MKRDPDYIVRIERAIKEKYGEETIRNPKSSWSQEKEKEYLMILKKIYNERYIQEEERVEHNGFLVSKKLLIKEDNRACPVCNEYSCNIRDDYYMIKYDCCFKCYVKHIER